MCIVKEEIPGIHFTGEAKTEIRIKQKPTIVIKPIRSSMTKGDSVNINCYVSNKGEAYLRNNTAINICFANNTNVPGCSGIDSYNVTCTLTVVTNTSLTCGLGNCTHISQSSIFTVAKQGTIHPSIYLSTNMYLLIYLTVHLQSALSENYLSKMKSLL